MVEDNPYGLLRYEGEPVDPLYKLDGGDYVLYLGTFSKILSPGIRLGWLCAPPPVMEKVVLGKQAADLCTSTLTQYFVREYFGEGRWREYVDDLCGIYRERRDAMLEALERFFPDGTTWSRPEGGLFCWATLPAYIDTTDLLAKALRENVAFVPGAAAYVDGRGGSDDAAQLLRLAAGRDPRGDQADRQRDRRAGATSTNRLRANIGYPVPRLTRPPPDAKPEAGGRTRFRDPVSPRGPMKVAVLKGGRGLERQVSLRSGARVEDALAALGHEVVAIDVGADLVATLKAERPEVAFVALHGSGGEDGTVQELLEILRIPYTGPGVRACVRAIDKVAAKHDLRAAGVPTPDWAAFNALAFRELGAAETLDGDRGEPRLPAGDQAGGRGSSLGVRFAASADEVPEALVAAFSYDDRVLLERHVEGRELAISLINGIALPAVEALPARGGPLQLRGALRDRPHRVRLPGRPRRRRGPDPRRGAAHLGRARLRRLLPRRPDPRRRTARRCWRRTRSRASPTPRCCRWPPRRRASDSSAWSSGCWSSRSSASRRPAPPARRSRPYRRPGRSRPRQRDLRSRPGRPRSQTRSRARSRRRPGRVAARARDGRASGCRG